jgi:hypothetical protein
LNNANATVVFTHLSRKRKHLLHNDGEEDEEEDEMFDYFYINPPDKKLQLAIASHISLGGNLTSLFQHSMMSKI